MRKELKAQIIEQVSAQIKEYPNFYITDISGLNAVQTTKLRRACFDKGVKLTVVKNTLFAKALEQVGNEDMKQLLDVLKGNTAVMYTEVPATPGKIIKDLHKQGLQKPLVKGAYVQECLFFGEESLNELASIKTREELIGDIITLLQSPINRVISALENKDNKEGETAETEAPAEAEAPAAE